MSIWKETTVFFGLCFEKKERKKKAYLNSVSKPIFREERKKAMMSHTYVSLVHISLCITLLNSGKQLYNKEK